MEHPVSFIRKNLNWIRTILDPTMLNCPTQPGITGGWFSGKIRLVARNNPATSKYNWVIWKYPEGHKKVRKNLHFPIGQILEYPKLLGNKPAD